MSRTARGRRTGATTTAVLAAGALLTAGCASSGSGSATSTSAPSSSASSSAPSSAGASSASSSPALSGSVTVFAAASLTGTFTELGQQFQAAHPGASVRFSFGASSTLAQQILAGAPADVFASAATKDMDTVTAAGDADAPVPFATNTAEVAVAPASASKVRALPDLAAPGVKVALCQPQVPCGALAQTVLGKAHLSLAPVTQGLDVKSTLAYVTSGQVDAAVVYTTDVRAAGSSVVGVPVPEQDQARTTYPIATVKRTQDPALAHAFARYVTSDQGRAVLAQAGFAAP